MSSRRLTRKEIVQEDRIRSVLTRLYEWALENVRVLISVGVLLLVGTLSLYLWQQYQSFQAAALHADFTEALKFYHARVGDEDPVGEQPPAHDHVVSPYHFESEEERDRKALEAFSELADRYPRTALGQFSRYYVGLIHHRAGRVEEAVATLEQVTREGREMEAKNLARHFLAQLALLEEDYQRAVRYFTEIVEDPSPRFPLQSVLMRLAQSLESMGDSEAALERYRQVTTEFPGTEVSRQAQSRIDYLEARIKASDS